MSGLFINARFKTQAVTGVQRVAHCLSDRISIPKTFISPGRALPGPVGHAWEQALLPLKVGDGLLWSPSNTGPLCVRNQIVTVHDAAVFEHPEWFSRSFTRLYHTIVPRLARRVRKIVTVSSYSRSRLAECFAIGLDKIEVVYNGVDDKFSPRPQGDIESEALKYGVEPFRYFIAVATREPRKNLVLLLRAWAALDKTLIPGFKLLLVGRLGPRSVFADAAISESIALDASVVTAGYVADHALPALISGAVAMVYPSVYEGFGLPALEAMACGTPVITTRLTSLPEVTGDDALFVDPEDPTNLAETLLRIANEPSLREDLANRGVERAKLFNWDSSARKMDDIIQSFL